MKSIDRVTVSIHKKELTRRQRRTDDVYKRERIVKIEVWGSPIQVRSSDVNGSFNGCHAVESRVAQEV